MSKRIIICCDGTWNEPENVEAERRVTTNVLKLVRAIRPRDPETGTEQVVFYDQGVGTGGIGLANKLIGGGTGLGISENIRDCYRFLAHNYLEGDEVYCFGFSRGAYTVRSLSGLLEAVGLLEKGDMELFPEAYAYYRTPPKERKRSRFAPMMKNLQRITPKITFLGVWDTVGALGAPTPLLGRISRHWVGFHNESLSKIVENAYQALAIDERRKPFAPSIWNKKSGQKQVQQVWFAGVHSNIGGGYADSGLSDIAFEWMAKRAMECGLVFNLQFLANKKKVNPRIDGKLEDSFSLGYKMLKAFRVPPLVRPIGRVEHVGEMIHESVVQMFLSQKLHYRPVNLLAQSDDPAELISTVDDHQMFTLDGTSIPVFKERKKLRSALTGISGTLTIEGQPPLPCNLLNISIAGGAKLQMQTPPPPGTRAKLESTSTGTKEVAILWSHDGTAGVKFAA